MVPETPIDGNGVVNPRVNDFLLEFSKHAEQLDKHLDKLKSPCGFPLYTSMDVRDAEWKLGVVDVNIFPAGWNNLTPRDADRAAQKFAEFFKKNLSPKDNWKIAVFPEAHTSNLGYLENLHGLLKILVKGGAQAHLVWPGDPPIPKPWTAKTLNGNEITYLPSAEGLKNIDAVVLNHDLTGGVPPALKSVTAPVFPSPNLGWFRRRKSRHFEIVDSLLKILEQSVPGFDPFFYSAKTLRFENPDFETDAGLALMADRAESFLKELHQEYLRRGIQLSPTLFVKNDAGTYGMGVISVKNTQEIREATRRMRNRMRMGKESVPVSQVIFQEAIPSALSYVDAASQTKVSAEPVIYLVGGNPIGGFLRVHEKLGPDAQIENLNQPGSVLESLECPDHPGRPPRPLPKIRGQNTCQQLGSHQVYGFLGKLHSVAAGLEDCPDEFIGSSKKESHR